jgi:hypothetical protein
MRYVCEGESDVWELGDGVCETSWRFIAVLLTGFPALRLFRSAKWRKYHASPSQKKFIRKRWGLKNDDPDEAATSSEGAQLERLTKGEAANIITRLKHGAQVRILRF